MGKTNRSELAPGRVTLHKSHRDKVAQLERSSDIKNDHFLVKFYI
jgi:hypothetical protein